MLLLSGVLLVGCASVPTDYPREPLTAFPDYQDTSVGRLFEEVAVQHSGQSGFQIIRLGRVALTARLAMVDLAEKSLDLQYYIWERDTSGRLLVERLARAADRGVRVRVLVDDINIKRPDSDLAAFDAHPNIEVRSFNPFAHRSAKMLDFLVDFGRVNHRMHNKVIVVDNALAIVGGRNIGDHYFGVHTEANFRDLDIAAVGPIVREISDTFDVFWNSEWAVPAAAFVDEPATEEDFREGVAALREWLTAADYPYPIDQDTEEHKQYLALYRENFIWAPGEVLFDDPALVGEDAESAVVRDALYRRVSEAEEEILIEAAYFITGTRSLDTTQRLNERGVKVRVLTNSLASNNVISAHAGYSKYRQGLIENGVEIYELRPDSGSVTRSWSKVAGRSESNLHTKAIVFDRETAFIGSYNLDPRSAKINTELGLMIESAELALRVAEYMDEGVRPENSYRVILNEEGDGLVWVTDEDGEEVRYYKDPESTFGQRFKAGFIKILPVESQL